jgi:lactate permease
LGRILSNTVSSAVRSSIGIASMVGFAMMMDQTGMTYLLAIGLSRTLESVFPFLSPFIGLLGAFMTGSNTNSNVVFAGLQQQTAGLLGLPATVILAAQTTGGSLGSMLAPAKIIVGCSTAGLAGEEGQVLRRTIVYGVLITIVIGIVTWLAVHTV